MVQLFLFMENLSLVKNMPHIFFREVEKFVNHMFCHYTQFQAKTRNKWKLGKTNGIMFDKDQLLNSKVSFQMIYTEYI